MRQHAKLKESKIPWIGKIPNHWNLIRGKFLFIEKKEKNSDLKCTNLLSLTLSGVLKKDIHSNDGLRPEDYSTYQIFNPKDLVFKLIDLGNIRTSRVGILSEKGIMSGAYIRLIPSKNIDSTYFYYQFYDFYQKNIFNSMGDPGVRSSINSTELLNFVLVVPPINEQKKISKILDEKIPVIDFQISNNEKLIKLLEEKKQSLANTILLRGINTKVKLKNTDIEWLGKVPKHWKSSKLIEIIKRKDERNGDCNRTMLSVSQYLGIIEKEYESDSQKRTLDELSKYLVVKPSNLVVNVMWLQFRGLGVSFIEGIVSPDYHVYEIISDEIYPQFLNYLLRSDVYLNEYPKHLRGIRPNSSRIPGYDFLRLPIFLPPINEQKEITKEINFNHKITDQLILQLHHYNQKLKEFRKSFISTLVYGNTIIGEENKN